MRASCARARGGERGREKENKERREAGLSLRGVCESNEVCVCVWSVGEVVIREGGSQK